MPGDGTMRSGTATAALPRDEKRTVATASATADRPVRRAAPVSRQGNRTLAATLASVAALVFLTAVALAILIHYAEVHHILAQL